MPYQSRGFWLCNRCHRFFDDYHEANYHEAIGECDPTRPLHQQQPPQTLPAQPTNLPQAHPSSHGPSPPPRMEGAQQQQHLSGYHHHYASMRPAQHPSHAAAAAATSASREIMSLPAPGPRALMGNSEAAAQLTEHDAVAVRNIEVFAVDHPDAVDSFGMRLTFGIVGIRCIHCLEQPQVALPRSTIFPSSLQEIGDCIREVAEWHLGKCHVAPQSVRKVLVEALQHRHKAKNEGGASWMQEEEDRGKLLDYCATRCRELRLVDCYPPRSGIMFSYYGARNVHPSEGIQPFEETKQPARPASSLDEPFDPADIPFDDLNPEPFMVPDQSIETGGYDSMPANFPFFREPSGDWSCKFCQGLHPQYRDGQARWAASNRTPPPAHFIDFHLNHCHMYQQSLLQDYRGPPNPVALPNPMRPTEMRHERVTTPTAAPSAATARRSSQQSVSSVGVARSAAAGETESSSGPQSPYTRAMSYLDAHDLSAVDVDGTPLPTEARLCSGDDRLLLTDYFYYLFKQLRLCRFTENDRKTRGGKRQTIQIGYGGLQCVHCAGQQNPRKFFWASVDRIANSFAEMPNHILKCRHCPPATRNALLALKETHAEQMTRLPRGSQKVFLRRMWYRLHKNDPKEKSASGSDSSAPVASRRRAQPPPAIETSIPQVSPRPTKVAKKKDVTEGSPGTSVSDGTVVVVERSTEEAAKALAYASMQTGPPSPSSRVLLSTPEDKQWLSEQDCFVRKQVEVFCATREDVDLANGFAKEGQVGIRCIHCALSKQGAHNGGGVAYPASIAAMYDSVREFHRTHLESCSNLPQDIRNRLETAKGASSLSSVLRNYFQMSAKSIGLVDTKDGIRATGQSVPLQSQEFTFAERKSPPGEGKESPKPEEGKGGREGEQKV